ncbi:MAG: divalent cation tolerance protein CutA [Bacilli bacterium]|nr:divalent cation tolerance protein CutA [Bacilli bacterium]
MQLFENFISYRRSETLPEVQNIYHTLIHNGYSTFCDIYSLNSGRFDENLLNIIKGCTNFILVLNAHSLDRCNNDDDWLKYEIKTALEAKKNIICVYVGEFTFPEYLPEEINAIRYYNGINYSFLYFDSFIDSICSRFLVRDVDTKISDDNRDFLIIDNILVKYLGSANIVYIPRNVKSIGQKAFKDMTQINKIIFNEDLEEICDFAFERCINIANIIFPDKLQSVGVRAFNRCYNLSFVAFNNNLCSIGEESFRFCGQLKVVRFGKYITSIPGSAFNECNKLALFDIDVENESYCTIDGLLYDKTQKTIIRCPEAYSKDLVNINSTVETIDSYCFYKCLNVIDIILPKNLLKVNSFAFAYCKKIMSLTLGDYIEEFDITAIAGWNSTQRIVVSKRFNPLIKYQIEKQLYEKFDVIQNYDENISKYIMLKTTFESLEEASNMANMLLSSKYIASAQINKLNVFYTWNDEYCHEQEYELSCITKTTLFEILEKFIKLNHSYECCQIISIPIIGVSEEFGNWIDEQIIKQEDV